MTYFKTLTLTGCSKLETEDGRGDPVGHLEVEGLLHEGQDQEPPNRKNRFVLKKLIGGRLILFHIVQKSNHHDGNLIGILRCYPSPFIFDRKTSFCLFFFFVFSVHLTTCSKIRTAAPSFRGDHCPFFTPNGRIWFSTQAPSIPIFLNPCDPYVKLCSISPTWEGTPPYSIHSLVREPHIDSEKVTNFRQNSQRCLTIFPNIH